MKNNKIREVKVHLVSQPVTGGFADATRKVECIGFTIVRITTEDGLEGFGVTYHEVGGEATKMLIEKISLRSSSAEIPLRQRKSGMKCSDISGEWGERG